MNKFYKNNGEESIYKETGSLDAESSNLEHLKEMIGTPFTSRIYMLYYPEKNHLYLSDTKIDSEFCFGIHITNVPPSLIQFDSK